MSRVPNKTMRARLGWTSFFVGATAIGVGAAMAHLGGELQYSRGIVLSWLDARGLVPKYKWAIPVASEPSFLSMTDDKLFLILAALTIAMAAGAMCLALLAEIRREPNLLLSAGYTCGALALVFFRPLYCLVAMITGIIIVMVIRQHRRERGT